MSADQLQQAIKLGVAKINTDTDLPLAYTATVSEVLSNLLKEFDPRKILWPAKDAKKVASEGKICLFGSTGKVKHPFSFSLMIVFFLSKD